MGDDVSSTATSATPGVVSSDELPPGRLREVERGEYEILNEIGRGGLGRVLLARDERLGRVVALKELHRVGSDAQARFLREAAVTARLQHPSIVPLYEAGRWPSGEPFYAMKLISGYSLKELIDKAEGSWSERVALLPNVIAVADAIAYAHSEGVIHRDLKPANVVVGAFGETVVIDWGLAKLVDAPELEARGDVGPLEDDLQTRAGAVMGTPAYMPPEQAAGEGVDARADVFALGAMLYHVLAGVAPKDPRPLAEREPRTPRELAAIVEKAMATAPTDRYPSARELAADLRRFQSGQLVSVVRYSLGQLLRRWLWRHRIVVGVASAALVALAIMGVISVRRIEHARVAAEEARAAAEKLVVEGYVEQGRRALLDEDTPRALAFLEKAWSMGARSDALRFMLARAAEPYRAQVAVMKHDDIVSSVAFSPDDRVVATASNDGTVGLWDGSTGTGLGKVALGGKCYGLSFSRDSHRLLTACTKGIGLIDVPARTGRLLPRSNPARDVRFSADETRFASAEDDGTVTIWDTEHFTPIVSMHAHAKPAVFVRFSPDGTLVSSGLDGKARLWNSDGSLRATLEPVGIAADSWPCVEFSHDGSRVIAISPDQDARVWTTSGRPLFTLSGRGSPATSARFSPDDRLMVTTNLAGNATIWDVSSGRVVHNLDHHGGPVITTAFDASGSLLVALDDGTATLWDVNEGVPIARLVGHQSAMVDGSFATNGKSVVTASLDGTARLWHLSEIVRPLVLHTVGGGAQFTTATQVVGIDEKTQAVRLWELPSGHSLRTFVQGTSFTMWAVDPSGRFLATVLGDVVKVWSIDSGALRGTVHTPPGTQIVAIDARGERLASVDPSYVVDLWDVASGALLRQLPGLNASPDDMEFDPAGTRLITSGREGKAIVWDVATGTQLLVLSETSLRVKTATFDPSGTLIATTAGSFIHLWDAQTGRSRTIIDAAGGETSYASFNETGSLVAVANADRTVKIADVATGQIIARFGGQSDQVVYPGLEGDALLSGAADGRVIIFPLWRGLPEQELSRFVRCHVPYRVDGNYLVAAEPSCSESPATSSTWPRSHP